MSKALFLSEFIFFVFFLARLFHVSNGDVGTATHYSPPYLPTACGGSDISQFPTNNLFAAAGEGIWENGAACGRQYLVRCLSAAEPKACVPDRTIQITIVDRAVATVSNPARADATMVMSTTAYNSVVQGNAAIVNIEYQQA